MTNNICGLCVSLWTISSMLVMVAFIPSSDAIYNVGRIKCTDTLERLRVESNDEVVVQCPSGCLEGYCKVIGSGPYTTASSVCCAAIHNGTLHNDEGAEIRVEIFHKLIPHFIGSTRHGVKSRNEFQQSTVTFITKRIHKIETTTTTTTTSTIGYTSTSIRTRSPSNQPTSSAAPQTTLLYQPPSSSPSKIATPGPNVLNEVTTVHSEIQDAEQKEEDIHEDKDSSRNIEATTEATLDYIFENEEERSQNEIKEDQESHETTQSPPTSRQPIPSTTLDLDEEPIATTDTAEEHHSNLSVPSHFFAVGVVFVFISGLVCGIVCMYCRRKAIKVKSKRPRTSAGTTRRENSRAVCEEGDICVCYQSLNSSKQGLLLYDPETCDRPCPIRSPQEVNSLLDDVTMTKALNFEKSFNRGEKGKGKCKIRYEEECAAACSGACNPAQFDY